MRFLASFPDLVTTVSDKGIQLHQFASGSFDAPVKGGLVRATIGTRYPWDGDIEISIEESVAEPWTLSIRVPEWCSSATARLGGAETVVESGPGTIELSRSWRAGDRVALELAMSPRVTIPDIRIDAVRGTIALERGPLVYAVEDADLPEGASVESLEVEASPSLEVVTRPEPGLGELTWLSLDAQTRDDPTRTKWPYRNNAEQGPPTLSPVRPAKIHALPYFAWGNRAGLGMRVWLPTRMHKGNH
jgi:hypothetical protein